MAEDCCTWVITVRVLYMSGQRTKGNNDGTIGLHVTATPLRRPSLWYREDVILQSLFHFGTRVFFNGGCGGLGFMDGWNQRHALSGWGMNNGDG